MNLRFDLPREAEATLQLFDVRGRAVRRLASGPFVAGPHQLAWDGRLEGGALAPAGVYVVRLDSEGRTVSRRLLRLP